MSTLTLKNLPADLHERLRARARAHRRSLNQEAIACIEAALARPVPDADAILEQARGLQGAAEEHLSSGEASPTSRAVFDEVLRSRCTAYDCEFVALARAWNVPLVTSDRDVLAAFPDVAVTPAGFLVAIA